MLFSGKSAKTIELKYDASTISNASMLLLISKKGNSTPAFSNAPRKEAVKKESGPKSLKNVITDKLFVLILTGENTNPNTKTTRSWQKENI